MAIPWPGIPGEISTNEAPNHTPKSCIFQLLVID
jgi:hypothetical protein